MARLTIAFWNVANLFDVPILAGGLVPNHRGPTSAAELDAKVAKVVETLRALRRPGRPPELVGLAEIATEPLVKRIARALRPRDPGRIAWIWAAPKDAKEQTGLALLYDTKAVANVTVLDQHMPDARSRPRILWAKCHVSKGSRAPLRRCQPLEESPPVARSRAR